MQESGRLIVVSNRLPVALVRDGEAWSTKRSAGGLATAMDPILRKEGGVWIGWSGAKEEDPPEALELLKREQSAIAVNLPADVAEKFYEGYSNQALWPLFHNFPSRLRFDPDTWEAYNEANRRFSDAVVEQYQPGDRIWVHDYHLMLLPRMLREQLPEASIGFFLHIPFPPSEIFAILPRGEELLEGLLGGDLIAFHTHVHLQHFRRSLRRLLGIESTVDQVHAQGRLARIQALPIGIAPQEFLGALTDPETEQQIEKLRTEYSGRQVIVAVDRLDYTKGLPERLRTFRRLLITFPELKEKVVLLQVAVPSRENIESYQELTSEVHQLITEINGTFGTQDWVPIVYIYRGISRSELVALYRFAAVGWVSPLRDGMNLVAKEYVACKPDGDGVLVLSSFAGAAAEMGEALLVNPYDEERTAAAVERALSMTLEDKRDRMLALHERVLRNDVFAWGDRFLNALSEAAETRGQGAKGTPARLPVHDLQSSYEQASRRVLLLDYDGTLVSLTDRPRDAVPDDELRSVLSQLSDDPANNVVVISGRRAAEIDAWLSKIPRLGLAAEHGARWRPAGAEDWSGRAASTDWKSTVRPILEHYVDRIPGSCIEEKDFALVWHYRTAEPEFGEWLATELVAMLDGMLAETELRAYRGNKIVEVKPLWANKGQIAQQLLVEHQGADFLLGIGDDRTDEDLFAVFPPDAWTVHVGESASTARFRVPDVRSVRQILKGLATVQASRA
jgi:trehalose 6-phosphate synthase/phosphatase